MEFKGEKPHFVLVPFMAQGHMIPMLDFALLLANQGALVTFITTPYNASRIESTIAHATKLSLPIRFVELTFPCQELGLPESCENVDVVPTGFWLNFFNGLNLLAKPLEQCLSYHQKPDCMIADACQHWTQEVANNLRIPRLTFCSMCCFTLLCSHNIHHSKVFNISVTDDHKPFEVPGLEEKIMVTKHQTEIYSKENGFEDFVKKVNEAQIASNGYVMNTFDDLEPKHIENFEKGKGKKIWTVGPFSLRSKDISDMAERGNKASIDATKCMSWLDSKRTKSVIYVSFGSLALVEPQQLVEIGTGLESSNHPFIWVIKKNEVSSKVEAWLTHEGSFEERIGCRGLIIKGWAPQIMILSHRAVGGFMTHCGWNSTLEGLSAGVPMITWPHFADQFLNERMVVDVLKTGVPIGVKKRNEQELLVNREDIEKAVRSLMGEGEDAEERRKNAVEIQGKANKAMKEGGTSYENMKSLIHCYSKDGNKNDE